MMWRQLNMKYKYFRVHMHVAVSFFSEGEKHYRAFGLPQGARYIRSDVDYLGHCRIVVEHHSFPELKDYEEIPEINVTFEKVLGKEVDEDGRSRRDQKS